MLVAAIIASALTACKKDDTKPGDDHDHDHEAELITTMTLIFDDTTSANEDVIATFSDPDGDGGNGPAQFDTINLKSNKIYHVSILLLDNSKSPADTISNEVAEEANEHHLFFHFTGANITHTYLDEDTNTPPLPIGLMTRWVTGVASTGTSQIILKHQPGVKDGTQIPGETDVDVTFQTKIH